MTTTTNAPAPLKTPQQVLDYLYDYQDDSLADVAYALFEHFYVSKQTFREAMDKYMDGDTEMTQR